jgi:hypothetical protein
MLAGDSGPEPESRWNHEWNHGSSLPLSVGRGLQVRLIEHGRDRAR